VRDFSFVSVALSFVEGPRLAGIAVNGGVLAAVRQRDGSRAAVEVVPMRGWDRVAKGLVPRNGEDPFVVKYLVSPR
jgi:hypothetical protein